MEPATILVVDDETDIVSLLEYNLKRENYAVLTAKDGESALRSARENHPDLILLDLMLPGVDGLEVCKVLKADPATAAIHIIMLTAVNFDYQFFIKTHKINNVVIHGLLSTEFKTIQLLVL